MAKLRTRSAYEACLEVCGRLEHPGLGIDMPIWVDHIGHYGGSYSVTREIELPSRN